MSTEILIRPTLHYNPTLRRRLLFERRRGQLILWLPWGRVIILTWRQW